MSTCSRARTSKQSERGIVLVAALVLAVLYFALMELMMVDASRSLNEAQRFRARVVAGTLAENAVELAAANMVTAPDLSPKTYSDDQGMIRGTLNRQAETYRIVAEGHATGVVQQTMTVTVQGRIKGTNVTVDYADHSQ